MYIFRISKLIINMNSSKGHQFMENFQRKCQENVKKCCGDKVLQIFNNISKGGEQWLKEFNLNLQTITNKYF